MKHKQEKVLNLKAGKFDKERLTKSERNLLKKVRQLRKNKRTMWSELLEA